MALFKYNVMTFFLISFVVNVLLMVFQNASSTLLKIAAVFYFN